MINIKTLPIEAGIYKLINLINGKIYIGKSKNLNKRISQHNHLSSKQVIDKAIKKYTLDNFIVEILYIQETFNNEELLKIEAEFIKEWNATDKIWGYNICEYGTDLGGIKLSEERKKEISEYNKKFRTGKNHPMFGKRHSETTKKKMSKVKMGKFSGDKSPRFGVKASNKTKEKIRAARQKQNMTFCYQGVKQIDKTTKKLIKIWDSMTEAAIFFKGTREASANISVVCRKLRKTAFGFCWEYI